MKKRQVDRLVPGSCSQVIAHAAYKKSRGKRPSMSFAGEKNPRKALQEALFLTGVHSEVMSRPNECEKEEYPLKRSEALKKATAIGTLIMEGVNRLNHTPVKDLPLLAMMAPLSRFFTDAKAEGEIDFDSLVPEVLEILIYGSVAKADQDEVGDIDMMVLDNGFFSEFFQWKKTEDDEVNWYTGLTDNLHLLLTGWLGYKEDEIEDVFNGGSIDLHVLPVKMLKSRELRAEIASKHSDPHFLQNAFSSMLMQDRLTHELVPIGIDRLEEKYNVELSDLKA